MSIYLQVQSTLEDAGDSMSYEEEDPIRFNQVLQQSESTIAFDAVTGTITFLVAGIYKIDWSVVVQSTTSLTNPVLISLQSSQGDYVIGGSNQRQGGVSGSAILTFQNPGETIALINKSGKIVLGSLQVVANLVVCTAGDSNLGYEVDLSGQPSYQFGVGETFKFNQIVLDENPVITYDMETGEFTVSQPGSYLIHWVIDADHFLDFSICKNIYIALMVDGAVRSQWGYYTGEIYWPSFSNTVFLRIKESPAILSLKNLSQNTIVLSGGTNQGSISITQLS